MSTLRADTITNSAGTGAPSLSQGLRTTSILDTSGGNTVTINGILPVSAADVNGMTLLGTLTTTSGSTQTLSSLVLTDYKALLLEFSSVSHNSGTSQSFSVGSAQVATGISAANALNGTVYVSLNSGLATAVLARNTLPALANEGYTGSSGYSTATTSVSVTVSGGAFDLGSVRVYGMK